MAELSHSAPFYAGISNVRSFLSHFV